MRIRVITPSPTGLLDGNRVTARRWAGILRRLGHRVSVGHRYDGERYDLLIALHAFKSFESIRHFSQVYPERPLIVALSGTDIYRDIYHRSSQVKRSLELADRLVVLQKEALKEVPLSFHHKTSVIFQSAEPVQGKPPPKSYFRVCQVGNLRREKDPFQTAMASRLLPTSSRICIWHVGKALSRQMEQRANTENNRNARYRWVGPLSYGKTQALIASSHLVALTSRIEGSSNVLCEALASAVPVLASRISGLIGTLGPSYPGFFPTGDTAALAILLGKTERDRRFYRDLKEACSGVAWLVHPEREQQAWKDLLREVVRDH